MDRLVTHTQHRINASISVRRGPGWATARNRIDARKRRYVSREDDAVGGRRRADADNGPHGPPRDKRARTASKGNVIEQSPAGRYGHVNPGRVYV
ncbi:b69.1 [miniopterid betaherpesvirus 1]|uniref:B69.1 n=1 Tax=miniopterid betaherpesvirus 1 TaxID=3070189 RepID=I3VQ61_9BETA|nr:b69.1 [miniopterid betaherpesvirus 1]AFK83905.1 b69.1 [miniopterid betaherpesvirus 1]